MRSQMRRSSCSYGGSRLPAILVLLVLAGTCVLAYRHFFQRQGEAAASLIPKDAQMVATLDLKPSPEQVPTFTRIHNALHREEMDTRFDTVLSTVLSNSPIGKDLRPYVTTSMAFATLKSAPTAGAMPGGAGIAVNAPDMVALFAVSDTGRVRDILTQDAKKATLDGMDYYQVRSGDNIYMAVIGDYFVIGSKPAALMQVAKVHRGETPSIATMPDFQRARATLPGDANLMVFIPPDALRQATTALAPQSGNGRAPASPWVVIGMAVRSGGVETYVQVPYDAPAGSDLTHIAPFDMRLLNRLPPDAYGLMALSQPSKYWNPLVTATGSIAPLVGGPQEGGSRAINESLTRFEHETGMSIARDVLPGFQGNALLAIYPDTTGGAVNGIDGLIVLDDANGADPAALADKVRAYIERQSAAQGHNPVHFTSQTVNGATVWNVDTNSQDQLRQSLGAAATQAQQGFMSSIPGMGGMPGASPGGGFAGAGVNQNMSINSAPNSAPMGGPGSNQNVTINMPGGGTETIITKPDHSMVMTIRKPDGSAVTTVSGPNGNVVTTTTGPNGAITTTIGPNGAGNAQGAPGAPSMPMPNGGPASPVQHALGNKTLVYAQVGHAVLIASSQSMLDRALAAYTRNAGGGLAQSASYVQMDRQLPAGTQSLFMVDLPGIMQAFRPALTRSMSGNNAGITPEDILNMFGQHTGIIGAEQYDGKVVKAYYFMPLDYDKMIRMMGAGQRASGGPNAGMPTPPPVAPAPPGNGGVTQ